MSAPTKLPTEQHFRDLNRAMALVLLEECYDHAVSDGSSFNSKLDLLKLNVKLGDMEPKQQVAIAGNGFSINFIFSGAAPEPVERVVAGTVIEQSPEKLPVPVFLTTAESKISIPEPVEA